MPTMSPRDLRKIAPHVTTPRRRRSARRAPFALALALLLALQAPGHAHDDDGLRRLAERLVGNWGAPGEARVALHVAELPAGLPVALPLPAEFELVGSLVRYERDAVVSLQVVLDGPPRTPEAFAALREAFEASDWTVVTEQDPAGAGFVPTMPYLFGRACGPAGDGERPVAFLNAMPGTDEASDVRVDLTPAAWEGICVPGEPHHGEPFAPLPTLAAPEGGEVSAPLVAREPDHASAMAILRGGGELAAVIRHYESELGAAGWSPLPGAVATDFGARSPWTLTAADGAWIGVLVVDRPTRTGPVLLSFAVVSEPAP